ncbi:MAG: nucleotidyltransferase family protein [Methanolinea sp.]|nr:nucleotidyltransferase family protein [Methanolinea sp.]
MPGLQELVRKKRDDILKLAALHGARNVRLFGSAGRGEDRGGSDIDLLVEFEPGRSLLDHVALVQDLEELLGCHVDVVTEGSLHWYIREKVKGEARAL